MLRACLPITFFVLFALSAFGSKTRLPPVPDCASALVEDEALTRIWDNLTEGQASLIATGLRAYEENGTLLSGETARELFDMHYNKVVGRGAYRKKNSRSAMFVHPHYYWMAFDQAVQKRIAEFHEIRQGRPLAADEEATFRRLTDFNVLKIHFFTDGGGYPEGFLEYAAHRRAELLPRLIEAALDHLSVTGELLTPANAEKITGVRYEQLMGLSQNNYLGKFRAHSQDPVIDFWVGFAHAAERRIAEHGLATPDAVRNFSIFDVEDLGRKTGFRRGELSRKAVALFNFYRPKARAGFVEKVINQFLATGEFLTPANLERVTNRSWSEVFATKQFAKGTPSYYRRFFDDFFQFVESFVSARLRLMEVWPRGELPSASGVSREIQAAHLEAFNLFDLDLFGDEGIPKQLATVYASDLARAKLRAARRIAHHLNLTGELMDSASGFRICGTDWQRLVAKNSYAKGRERDFRRLFDDAEELWRAVAVAVSQMRGGYGTNANYLDRFNLEKMLALSRR